MLKKLTSLNQIKKKSATFLIAYAAVYLLTRLISLTLLPAHYDELLQLQRLDMLVNEAKILEGFDELFLLKWLQLPLIASLLWLPANPFWIGRFVSALAGLAGGIGSYTLGLELYHRRAVGIIASLLYLVTPFVLLYDRLIMPDGLLTSLGVWLMIFSVRVVRRRQMRWAVAAGLTAIAAGLTKESGFIYLVIPLSALIFLRSNDELVRQLWKPFMVIYGLSFLMIAAVASILILKPEIFEVYVGKTGGAGVFTWQLWLNNGQTTLSWLVNLMTPPFLILGAAGGVVALFRRDRPGLFLLTIPVVLPLAYILVSQAWFPRYLLPVVPPLLLLAAWLLVLLYDHLEQVRLVASQRLVVMAGFGLVIISYATVTDYWLLVDPSQARLTDREKWQYIEGWPTAYGLAEAAAYVQEITREYDEIYLAVNQNSTVVLKGLDIYFSQPDNVEVVTFDAYAGLVPTIDRLNKWALERPTFLILNTAREKGMNEIWQTPELFFQGIKRAEFAKPGNKASMDVYQWLSVPETVNQWAARNGVEPTIALSPQYLSEAENIPAGLPSEAELKRVNFVLIDMSTGLFNSPAQFGNVEEWLPLVPSDWVLTRHYPGLWYLFRLENNAPPQYPLQSLFNQTIALTGFDLSRQEYAPGETIPLTLHWQTIAAVPEDYTIFVQLIGAGDAPPVQQEFQPLLPTSQWQIGQRLTDGYDLLLVSNISPGVYKLGVGVYTPATGERLSALQDNGHSWPDNVINLTDIVITRSEKSNAR